MHKFVIFCLVITVVTGCSKDSGSSSKKVKVTKPISTPEQEQEQETQPLVPDEFSHLLKTNIINRTMYSCLLDPNELPLKTIIDPIAMDGSRVSNFEIVLNKTFVKRVVADLIAKSRGEKISPDFFWSNLAPNLANILNDYLAHRYLNLSSSQFDLLRRLVAYTLTYFMEKQDYSVGYVVQYGEDRTLKIAFSSETNITEHIQVCSMQDLSDYVIIPSNLLTTSQITGAVYCTGGSHKVKLTVYNNDLLKIDIQSKNKKYNIDLPRSDIEIDYSEVEIESEGSDLEISLNLRKKIASRTRRGWWGRTFGRDYNYTYFSDQYSSLELSIEAKDFEFDEDDLNCSTLKNFSFKIK